MLRGFNPIDACHDEIRYMTQYSAVRKTLTHGCAAKFLY